MKKALAFGLVVILALVLVESVAAQTRIIINPGPLYIVRVNGQIRELRVLKEGDNMRLRFFRENEFLGDELFDKDDVKIEDNYLENNGDWRDGYQKAYR